MKKIAIILIGLGILFFFLWIGFFWKFFKSNFAGSYPYAETWNLHATESEIIKAIGDLKYEHPDLNPPNKAVPNYRRHSYWYLEEFHYSDTDEDLEIYLRPNEDSSYTSLGLYSIWKHMDTLTPNYKLDYSTGKDINKDYSYFENRKQIRKFEERILNPIKRKIQSNRHL